MSAPRALPSPAGSATIAPMSDRQAMYRTRLDHLVSQAPYLTGLLPVLAPAAIPGRDRPRMLAALRSELATRNEDLFILGVGDGSAINLIARDGVAQRKRLHLIVFLPTEAEDLARAMADGAITALLACPQATMHLIRTLDEVRALLQRIYGSHAEIVRVAGAGILADHPLCPAAATVRDQWLPAIRKTLAERLDCLGNDVYDTFLGAKHALMHGRALVRHPRLGDILRAGAGASAICIASGPSARPHFDRIRAIQHEHIIICADSILGGLVDAGIQPDFVCMVERTDDMHRLVDHVAGRTTATMVALPVLHPSSIAGFGDRVVWFWNADDLYPWLDPAHPRSNTGRSAGTATAAVAAVLGVSDAWLVGHDLAYHDGRSHADGTATYATEQQALVTKVLDRNHPNYYYRRFSVPRNGGGTVETTGVWEIFRSDLEGIIAACPGIRFRNPNISDGVGAVIAHAVPGDLPGPTGTPISKPTPRRAWDDTAWTTFRDRALRLRDDLATIRSRCATMQQELAQVRPLGVTLRQAVDLADRLDVSKMVSEDNRPLITYVFRAALRNLTLRLHYNTFVRTDAERAWNQVQVLRLFAATMPGLVARLEPELEKALESYA
jgi:hypothetical protein